MWCPIQGPCLETDLAELQQPEEAWSRGWKGVHLGGLQLPVCWVPWLPAVPDKHRLPGPSVCLLSSHLTVRAWYTTCFFCGTLSCLGSELLLALGSAQPKCEGVDWSDFAAACHRKPHSGTGELIPSSHQNGKRGGRWGRCWIPDL